MLATLRKDSIDQTCKKIVCAAGIPPPVMETLELLELLLALAAQNETAEGELRR